jgi:hypothetical protein
VLTDVFTVVRTNAYLTGVDCQLGAESLAENGAPPRIVWTPTTDSFEPGKRINTPGLSTKEPKAFGTRRAGVRARVWAVGNGTALGDIAACEELVRRLLAAVHQETFGSYRVESMSWVLADGAELVQLGRTCDVNLAFDIPVFFDASRTAPLTVVTFAGMDGGMTFPAGDVAATPSP